MKYIDKILNQITMYRVVVYFLLVLLFVAFILSVFGILPYNPLYLALSTGLLVSVSYITNNVFSYCFNVPTNVESVYITALILALIITPPTTLHGLFFISWAAVLSMASKYILTINKKHIFNPVAIAVFITSVAIKGSATWWVGNLYLAPIVFVGGFLIVRKIQREALVFTFSGVAILTAIIFTIIGGNNVLTTMQAILFHSSLLFFASIMITEPLTTPPTKKLQMIYGAIVGFLFVPQVHIGSFYTTPEIALLIGNIFSYIVSPKYKLVLNLSDKVRINSDTYDFIFNLKEKLKFTPGQYMEWTLSHPNTDSRGNRRYFTIASSPTEDKLRIGVKFHNPGSSYKQNMLSMDNTKIIVAAGLAGNFTLPKNKNEKLAFLAGGIGITPFRSMIKYLVDNNERRDIVLFYSNKVISEICYADVFDEAEGKLGIKTVYALTDTTQINSGWKGVIGRIDEDVLKKELPDFITRKFYLSGPRGMVEAYEKSLSNMGVPKRNIKTDFFPGFV